MSFYHHQSRTDKRSIVWPTRPSPAHIPNPKLVFTFRRATLEDLAAASDTSHLQLLNLFDWESMKLPVNERKPSPVNMAIKMEMSSSEGTLTAEEKESSEEEHVEWPASPVSSRMITSRSQQPPPPQPQLQQSPILHSYLRRSTISEAAASPIMDRNGFYGKPPRPAHSKPVPDLYAVQPMYHPSANQQGMYQHYNNFQYAPSPYYGHQQYQHVPQPSHHHGQLMYGAVAPSHHQMSPQIMMSNHGSPSQPQHQQQWNRREDSARGYPKPLTILKKKLVRARHMNGGVNPGM